MAFQPMQQAALEQLGAAPGVVGSMVFDASGGVVASAFPPVFDPAGLRQLATHLASDGYFGEWLAGDKGTLDLAYADGQVVVRSLAGSWLLVLCTPQVNAQLLAMSLTQVVRRIRVPGASGQTGEVPLPKPAAPTPLDRLRKIASTELGGHADKALEILGAAGASPKDLLKAIGEIEKLVRLFIDKKKAEDVGRRMRAVVES
jgi:predicted regulator of Ras-like GTPase activity (Roadblock/LC7/MglB family)